MDGRLRDEDGLTVETAKGGLGELSVSVEGRKVVDTNRYLDMLPGSILKRVRERLAE